MPLCLLCHDKVHDCDLSTSALVREGMRLAKERGVTFGARPRHTHLAPQVRALRAQKFSFAKIAAQLGIAVSTAWLLTQPQTPTNQLTPCLITQKS